MSSTRRKQSASTKRPTHPDSGRVRAALAHLKVHPWYKDVRWSGKDYEVTVKGPLNSSAVPVSVLGYRLVYIVI